MEVELARHHGLFTDCKFRSVRAASTRGRCRLGDDQRRQQWILEASLQRYGVEAFTERRQHGGLDQKALGELIANYDGRQTG